MTSAALIEDKHVAFAVELADIARAVLRENRLARVDVSVKADRSLVTAMDILIEDRLRGMISARYPSHGIIGEERDWVRPGSEHVWVLDPIDGTTAFIAGMPVYGTLIALAVGGVPRLGIIDIPAIDSRWIGAEGRRTTRNGQEVSVRSCPSLAEAIMTNSNQDYLAQNERPALDRLRAATSARVYGGASLNYGLLADGRTDLALDGGQKVFDFAPFRPIVEGAGGIVTDWAGAPLTLESSGQLLGAGDARVHAQALDLVKDMKSGSAVSANA
ncbi:histidinol phosphatase-like enzyme (inositol monophosphatase family) [Ensifer adhaerens]|uniref:Histidinol phosphatase-like enzyme (Inositol monophosphatase family) n=1 Tax=Ensifer adhaerens TaxID=106592 RepID=A0ACC5SS91_ENSAD|nr:inositol monophosphatase family protein [Ensifer adhaerens]MBP1871722.1 histidinol phosphatase-like enzyme (inositol monophosphatase family) [Ensifer adhaerens]